MALNACIGHRKIRDLKELEIYCCSMGCGECIKITIDKTVRKILASNGKTLVRFYQQTDVSNCCNENLTIWNEEYDFDVAAEYQFIKS